MINQTLIQLFSSGQITRANPDVFDKVVESKSIEELAQELSEVKDHKHLHFQILTSPQKQKISDAYNLKRFLAGDVWLFKNWDLQSTEIFYANINHPAVSKKDIEACIDLTCDWLLARDFGSINWKRSTRFMNAIKVATHLSFTHGFQQNQKYLSLCERLLENYDSVHKALEESLLVHTLVVDDTSAMRLLFLEMSATKQDKCTLSIRRARLMNAILNKSQDVTEKHLDSVIGYVDLNDFGRVASIYKIPENHPRLRTILSDQRNRETLKGYMGLYSFHSGNKWLWDELQSS